MIYADTVDEAAKHRERFQKKWKLKCAAVIGSLEEAGEKLFTFTRRGVSPAIVTFSHTSDPYRVLRL